MMVDSVEECHVWRVQEASHVSQTPIYDMLARAMLGREPMSPPDRTAATADRGSRPPGEDRAPTTLPVRGFGAPRHAMTDRDT